MNPELLDQLNDLTSLTEMVLAAEAKMRTAIPASLDEDGSVANINKITTIIARMVNIRKTIAKMRTDIAQEKEAAAAEAEAANQADDSIATQSTDPIHNPAHSDPSDQSDQSYYSHQPSSLNLSRNRTLLTDTANPVCTMSPEPT